MIRVVCLFVFLCSGAVAQVQFDPDRTAVKDGWWDLRVAVGLSEVTPYRLFTLDNPRRLVIDFQDAIWPEIDPMALLSGDRATALRFEKLDGGWSRMVVDLAGPMQVETAALVTHQSGADLSIVLKRVSAASFSAAAGAPPHVVPPIAAPAPQTDRDSGGDFVVVVDPGHGGIDPGAERGGVQEAALMQQLGHELAQALNQLDGVTAVLTRDSDVFVPLDARVSVARAARADLFISLHADALSEDDASGASVYTLSADGGSVASRRMVERHERGDLLAGVDLATQTDRVATVLMGLARSETGPEGRRFADILVKNMQAARVRVNNQPRREGQLAVLSAADFPSVLVEVGFLSNAQDRRDLTDTAGRARLVATIVAAVATFSATAP